MRLATIRTATGLRAVRVDGDSAVETGESDVRALLERPDWADHAARADGPVHDAAGLDHAPLVPAPEKIICIGLNYRDHVQEMGNELPAHPTIFGKFAPSLIGARDEIELPAESEKVDWEVELTLVIGRSVRHADEQTARAAIAGYTVLNDVSMRDYQNRTKQFLQGKTWEHSTPLGPELVTPDELPADATTALRIHSALGGEVMQDSTTDQLVFSPVDLVVYLSTIVTLNPGDVIATGTPAGVGHARTPPRYLTDGAEIVTAVQGVGECRNICRAVR